MRPAVPLILGAMAAMSAGAALGQNGPPATVPDRFSATSPSISFNTPSIAFNEPAIQFASPPMTEEEVALGPKPPAPPPPQVSGLAVTEVEGGVRYTLSADILFDFDKATLRPKAAQALDAMGADVRQRFADGARFVVDGFTDSKGSDAYNLKLSVRRAEAVKAYLSGTGGFDGGTITTEGRGEASPVAPNETAAGEDDPEGRQKNRRVEILVRAAN